MRKQKMLDPVALGRNGGRNRAAALSPERRKEIAAMGGRAKAAKRKSGSVK